MSTDNNIYVAQPDLSITEEFLKLLCAGEAVREGMFHFTTIFDGKEKTKPKEIVGRLQDVWPQLATAHEEGHGVFVVVNKSNLQGRKKENIVGVRALFVDLDGTDPAKLESCVPPPTILVQSSPGRFHAYWVVTDFSLDDFDRYQKALIATFDGDQSVTGVNHLMRLPGTVHCKGEHHLVRIKRTSVGQYTKDDIRGLFAEEILQSLCAQETPRVDRRVIRNQQLQTREVEEMLSFIPADDYHTWIRCGMALHHQFGPVDGLPLFKNWSKSSDKHKEGEPAKIWKSFNGQADRNITIASLIKLAREHGFNRETTRPKRAYADYIELFRSCPEISGIVVEMLSNQLMVKSKGEWIPAEDFVTCACSYAVDQGGFSPPYFKYHINRFSRTQEPRLLIDIPEWDGIDRLAEICKLIRIDGFEPDAVYQFFRFWLVGLFRRLKDPTIQLPAIILRGPQGVGKDTLVTALTGGLGQYVKELNINGKEAEAWLHTAIVHKITEFDRTAAVDVARLKHLLTVDTTFCRLPYDPRPMQRKVRAGFIATANVEDILRDSTGNRRFWVLEMTYGGFDSRSNGSYQPHPRETYPGMFCRNDFEAERKQIIAQAQALARQDAFEPEASILKAMSVRVEELTPPDPNDELVEEWNVRARMIQADFRLDRAWLTNAEIAQHRIFEAISHSTGLPIRKIRHVLKLRGYCRRTNRDRGYNFDPEPAPTKRR